MGIELLKNKNIRKYILIILDALLIVLAGILSLEIRFDFELGPQQLMYREALLENTILYVAILLFVFYIFGLYKSLWRYASINEMISVALAGFWGNLSLYAVFSIMEVKLPRSFYIINIFLIMTAIGGLRFSYRILRRLRIDTPLKKHSIGKNTSKVLIIGAGEAGYMTAKELLQTNDLNMVPIGFLDDDSNKVGKKINGVPVISKIKNITQVVEDYGVDQIIIALPSASNKKKKEVLELCKNLGIKLKILPGIYELIDGSVDIKQIRDVDIEDLLGREPIKLDNPDIKSYIRGKTILVTGGGGSIGSELCRQIASYSPSTLIIFDIYENNAYDIQNELRKKYKDKLNLEVLIGSVRDEERLEEVFNTYKPEVVFHAAAHKHVPLMEDSPFEAIKNNVLGTMKVAKAAGRHKSEKFVLISTDKAVNPTNIMGASKRLAELITQDCNIEFEDTDYVAVRFGNVLGSNGSVIPLFKKQIASGGPITVTHPDIIRYFMTIPEAVQLVLQAGSMASGGEIFILDMGEPVKIVNLAEDLIKLSGFEPYEDIDIQFTGLRPGEKLYEELLLAEEGLSDTSNDKIFIGKPLDIKREDLSNILGEIFEYLDKKDIESLEITIKKLIPKYKEKQ